MPTVQTFSCYRECLLSWNRSQYCALKSHRLKCLHTAGKKDQKLKLSSCSSYVP